MINNYTQHLPPSSAGTDRGPALPKRLLTLVAAVTTLAGMGCFRATGTQRSPTAAVVLPESGGDKVHGLKVKGGSGNLYLGNDFIQVAIDDAVYGDPVRTPIAGAASGGSIIDAGYILLDSSYTRVSMPGNAMNRLALVVNQDPAQQMVFDRYVPATGGDRASITMSGGVLDGSGARIPGLAVTHSITLTQLDRFFTLSTTVTNTSAASQPIRNIGDCLVQQGGGYSFNVPANFDYQGNALPAASRWGVQIPGSDFTRPQQSSALTTSVQAPMVGLMDREPGANTLDSHCSLGLLPVDAEQMLVAADPQDLLTVPNNLRPVFPAHLVAGSLPLSPAGLAPGASITYRRRLYIIGGTSVATGIVGGLTIAANFPDQSNGLFNLMDTARYGDISIRPVQDFGRLDFTLSGMSQRQGPVPTEVRIERNVTAVTPPAQSSGDVWQLQRVEWFEPNENLASQAALAPSLLQVRLPVGIYRMVLTSVDQGQTFTQTRTRFQNTNPIASANGQNQVGLAGPLWIQKDQTFVVSTDDILSPLAAPDTADPNAVGPITSNPYSAHYFTTREANAPAGSLQPLRMTFVREGGPNPVMRRMRTMGSFYDSINKTPAVAAGTIPWQYQFRAGNEMFGTGFTKFLPAQFAWFANGGSYTAYAQRGPLSKLDQLSFSASDVQTETSHTFTVFPMGLPPGWTSFDLPGPGQATTGGFLPGEKLASATANGVQVVGHTEQDILVDAPALWYDFRIELGSVDLTPGQIPASLSAINRPIDMQFGQDPFVLGGRTSELNGFGPATALFTPVAGNAPLGGALPNTNWTLADFLAQAQGEYNVVHRPRDPVNGLFNLMAAAPVVADPASWWNLSGTLSFGRVNGAFDALELLRGESLDPADPTAWFAEFQQVRADWFALLNQQSPAFFTKALGLSSARFSLDTPVGLARTYLKATPTTEADLSGVLAALRSGAAVASTGPFLDVSVGSAGPGQLVPGPAASLTLAINLWKTDWMPVDEIRVMVNGNLARTISLLATPGALTQSGADPRLYTGTVTLPMAELTGGRDGWIVVEAGVPLATSGPYAAGTPWNLTMRGIYPIAVTNPIFVNVTGGTTYTPPVP